MRIERKWLVKEDVPNNLFIFEYTQTKQGYLSINPEIMVRSCLQKGKFIYTLTIRGSEDSEQEEAEIEIDNNYFITALKASNIKIEDLITKDKLRIRYGKHILELNSVFTRENISFRYIGVEFKSKEEAEQFIAPDWFGEEITYKPEYKMNNFWCRTRGGN